MTTCSSLDRITKFKAGAIDTESMTRGFSISNHVVECFQLHLKLMYEELGYVHNLI